jgi:tRNA-binding protein
MELPVKIQWSDFEKIDIRVGTILQAEEFPEARKPAYKLIIDFGPRLGIKKSSAQITDHYNIKDLENVQVIAVTNLKPKQIGNFISECLILGIYDAANHVVLLQPKQKVENGLKIG